MATHISIGSIIILQALACFRTLLITIDVTLSNNKSKLAYLDVNSTVNWIVVARYWFVHIQVPCGPVVS